MITDPEMDALGAEEVEHRLHRGDYNSADDVALVNRWLNNYKKEQEFLEKCRRAAASSSLDARRLSLVSTIIALASLAVSVAAIFRTSTHGP